MARMNNLLTAIEAEAMAEQHIRAEIIADGGEICSLTGRAKRRIDRQRDERKAEGRRERKQSRDERAALRSYKAARRGEVIYD